MAHDWGLRQRKDFSRRYRGCDVGLARKQGGNVRRQVEKTGRTKIKKRTRDGGGEGEGPGRGGKMQRKTGHTEHRNEGRSAEKSLSEGVTKKPRNVKKIKKTRRETHVEVREAVATRHSTMDPRGVGKTPTQEAPQKRRKPPGAKNVPLRKEQRGQWTKQ